jgi:hypothetical protein
MSKNKTVHDVQDAFSMEYPFLKLEFYKPVNGSFLPMKKHLPHSTSLEAAGLKKGGEIEVYKEMTVEELEKCFQLLFGLNVQVSRKSGILWLETTMTDKWSLQKQNEHGRQISLPEKEPVPDRGDSDIQ